MRNENMSNTATILQGQEILSPQDELTPSLSFFRQRASPFRQTDCYFF